MIKLKLLSVFFFVLQFEEHLFTVWPNHSTRHMANCSTDFTSRFKRTLLDLENYLVDLTSIPPTSFRNKRAAQANAGVDKTVSNCKKRTDDEAYTNCGLVNYETFIPGDFGRPT